MNNIWLWKGDQHRLPYLNDIHYECSYMAQFFQLFY